MATSLTSDPFAAIQSATNTHRAGHGCGAYPYDKGPLLGTLAAAVNAKRIVEVGTALGYTSLWFTHGANEGRVDTIEMDQEHVRIARQNFEDHRVADRIIVHHGEALTVLAQLEKGLYDLAFFDGFEPTLELLRGLRDRLRIGGLLICANMQMGGVKIEKHLADPKLWLTHSLGETAIAVKC